MRTEYVNEIKKLRQFVKMQTKEDIENFEILAYQLAQTKDLFVLKELLSLFHDDCEYSEVMWGLLHIVETYNNEDFVKTVLLNLNIMVPQATEWVARILYRILNHKYCFAILSNNLQLADKKILNMLLQLMYEDSESHRPAINILISKLHNS